jgi:hypothetical protein
MNLKEISPFLISISILLIACKREQLDSDVSSSLIATEIRGRVVDENNKGVKAALVKVGNEQSVTDDFGDFLFSKVEVNQNIAFVSVEKAGYFRSGRTILPDEANNIVKLKLIAKKIPIHISSNQGGKISLINSNGSTITFQANSFQTLDNQFYAGQVKIYTAYLDPEALDFPLIMPGNLVGIDSNGMLNGLRSYGMMAVEIESDDGRILKLADGKPATLSYVIPSSLKSSAPPNIPLWFFDERNGYWLQQGTAVKQGENFTGSVSHFTYWNVDVAYYQLQVRGTFRTPAGNVIPNHLVYLHDPVTNQTISAMTNMNGLLKTWIPANVALNLTMFDDCGASLYVTNVPATQKNVDLGTVTVSSNISLLNINGRIVDCQNNPVSNGTVYFVFNNNRFEAANSATDGKFSLQLFGCRQVQQVNVFSRNNLTNEESLQSSITIPADGQLNIGDLTTCGNITNQFIQIIRDQDTLNYRYPEYQDFKAVYLNPIPFNGANFRIYANNNISIFNEASIDMNGVNSSNAVFVELLTADADSIPSYIPSGNVPPVTFTEFGPVGGLVSGNFEGRLKNATRNGYTFYFKIIFKVKRFN